MGINTYNEPVIYIREDSQICKSEGFEVPSRVKVTLNERTLIATLNSVQSSLLLPNEASFSTYAWQFLQAKEGAFITVSHPEPINSLSYIRSKIYGNELTQFEINGIIQDLMAGQLSDIDIATFLAASASQSLSQRETLDLTRAMLNTGQKLSWPADIVVDKHCVGGLPGNRTTLIVVPIVAVFGLLIPKTSSRAITSPAGTADTMEVFSPVNLNLKMMRKVVEQENGCITWGGTVSLSPADDILIKIERIMDLDNKGQLVASILSKKLAAGSNHLVIDMPIGPTAKIRSFKQAEIIKTYLENIAKSFSLTLKVIMTDGREPVGRGIGPALEAQDVLAVLSRHANAPKDLRDRALTIAGQVMEFSAKVKAGTGKSIAKTILDSGEALKKFHAICLAQGGFFEIPKSRYQHVMIAEKAGKIINIHNRHIARVAKLAGAPSAKVAGVELLVKLHEQVEKEQPLYIIHGEAKGELTYASSFAQRNHNIIKIQ